MGSNLGQRGAEAKRRVCRSWPGSGVSLTRQDSFPSPLFTIPSTSSADQSVFPLSWQSLPSISFHACLRPYHTPSSPFPSTKLCACPIIFIFSKTPRENDFNLLLSCFPSPFLFLTICCKSWKFEWVFLFLLLPRSALVSTFFSPLISIKHLSWFIHRQWIII